MMRIGKTIKQPVVYILNDLEDLDPVKIILTDHGAGKGQLIVECAGDAWANYWPAMGEDRTLIDFLSTCQTDYVAGKLWNHSLVQRHEVDYDEICKRTGNPDINQETTLLYESDIHRVYGDAWPMDLPTKPRGEYAYLCRIVDAVIAAAKQLRVKS